jgi:predicted dehydrogenase
MQQVPSCSIRAIASRDGADANRLSIERTYSSCEALLDDPDVEAVNIPLPNNLHVEWCAKAVQAGKHVLCEKPLSLTAADPPPPVLAQRELAVLCHKQKKLTLAVVTLCDQTAGENHPRRTLRYRYGG